MSSDVDPPASPIVAASQSGGVHPVRIAVIDSGWDRSLSDQRVLRGVGLVDRRWPLAHRLSNDDDDWHGHGTRCTNVLLDAARGIDVIPIRVFGDRLETSPRVLAYAIDWACDHGIRLMNLSAGTFSDDAVPVLYAACLRARRKGAVVVAASEVNACKRAAYPAAFEPVLSVGPGTPTNPCGIDYRAGAEVECEVWSGKRLVRGLGGAMETGWGSSLAAPVVTGFIAGWMRESPSLDLDAVRDRLENLT
jgi:subtilisin family serine protease